MRYEGVEELFSVIAARRGSAVAIERASERISYAELERRSNQVANGLLRMGAEPKAPVGLLGENPVAMTVGILGILKAGCVFVPLDAGFPAKRLASMAEKVRPRWYVLESAQAGRLEQIAGASAHQLWLDGEELEREDAGGPERERERDGDDPCSIYFTSGSTGEPKAILGRLRGIDHYARWEIEALGIGPETRVSQLTSPSFDGFLKDIFVPLCAGGMACAPGDRRVAMDGPGLGAWIESAGIEVLHCVPSVWRSLLAEDPGGDRFPRLRWVALAGEALPPADVRRWQAVFGERIGLVNLYGPTETTVVKLYHIVEPGDAARPSIPIGRPLPGAAAMILNAAGQPSRQGAVGEIYIRTPHRSLGYYGEPELTRAAFVPNPFASDPEDLVYRTGDFGRLLGDGSLEFLGRKDQQVKVRGVRVELAEVENMLRGHDGVADVAVADREDSGGNRFLCAYVVPRRGLERGELREYMSERLPEAMVPSAYVELAELPRTLNGKVDRRALPSLEEGRSRQARPETRPRSPVEEIVAGIWEEVLRLPRIGLEDNFFEAGGHSLLATRVVLRIRGSLGVELPLRALFEAPTVAAMAKLVEQELRAGRSQELLPVRRVERNGDLPLSYAQQRLWFIAQLEPDNPAYNMPFALRLNGDLDRAALQRSLHEIVRRHEVLRTRFPEVDGAAVQRILPETASMPEIEETELRHLDHAEREAEALRLAQAEMLHPFDLANDWLLRVRLLRMEERQRVLLLTMHHIVSDAWSMEILVREFSQLYEAYSKGREPMLPELKIQYADFSVWQRQWLQGDLLQNQLQYWKARLEGLQPLRLPTDQPRSPGYAYQGKEEDFEIGLDLTLKLKALSQREGVTLFMTLLAAYQLTIARYIGQQDIAIGTDVANRTRLETEGLIGFFVNQLVLRTDFSSSPSFRNLLNQVQHTVLDAYTYQDLPFEKVVGAIQPERRSDESPLFNIKLVLQNAPHKALALSGLSVEGFELRGAPPKVDILLNLIETDQGLRGLNHYNADLFHASTIQGILQFYRATLATISKDDKLLDIPQQKLIHAIEQSVYSSLAGAATPHRSKIARSRQPHAIPTT